MVLNVKPTNFSDSRKQELMKELSKDQLIGLCGKIDKRLKKKFLAWLKSQDEDLTIGDWLSAKIREELNL